MPGPNNEARECVCDTVGPVHCLRHGPIGGIPPAETVEAFQEEIKEAQREIEARQHEAEKALGPHWQAKIRATFAKPDETSPAAGSTVTKDLAVDWPPAWKEALVKLSTIAKESLLIQEASEGDMRIAVDRIALVLYKLQRRIPHEPSAEAAALLQHLLEVTEDEAAAYPNCPCAEVYSLRERIADVMTRLWGADHE